MVFVLVELLLEFLNFSALLHETILFFYCNFTGMLSHSSEVQFTGMLCYWEKWQGISEIGLAFFVYCHLAIFHNCYARISNSKIATPPLQLCNTRFCQGNLLKCSGIFRNCNYSAPFRLSHLFLYLHSISFAIINNIIFIRLIRVTVHWKSVFDRFNYIHASYPFRHCCCSAILISKPIRRLR